MIDDQLATKLGILERFLSTENIWFMQDYNLKYDTYFKMGGNVKCFISPQSIDKFKNTLQFLMDNEIQYKVIGHTSNILLLEQVEYSVLISTKNLVGISIKEHCIDVDCGYSLQDFVRVMVMEGAVGFEGLEGIPGSIGGAIFMNAGAYGFQISDNLISVVCLNDKGELVELVKDQCNFSNRSSLFKNSKVVILTAKFRVPLGDRLEIEKSVERFHIARHSYQEFVYPNLGSLFSTTRFYGSFLNNNGFYRIFYAVLKIIYKNPVSLFVARKRPNNRAFNRLLHKFIKHTNYRPSIKSMNILINDGRTSFDQILSYIFTLRSYLSNQIKIENEIVLDPIYSIEHGFQTSYDKIRRELHVDRS
jgi:UDP-N-acetylmuramate dehydrogenase